MHDEGKLEFNFKFDFGIVRERERECGMSPCERLSG
jgi:hypothetical protein